MNNLPKSSTMLSKSFGMLALLLLSITYSTFAQSIPEKWNDASLLMDEKRYESAIDIWKELLEADPDNANLNYKVGQCYYHIKLEHVKAMPYFLAAKENTTLNYDPLSASEKKAPFEAIYYLAKIEHLTYKLDEAIDHFNQFINQTSKKNLLIEEAKREIEMCENAKKFVANPIEVEINNLGDVINSKYHEHSPVVSLDEGMLFFTSQRLRADSSNYYVLDNHGRHFEDIYVSYKDYNGIWQQPELLNFSRKNEHDATIGLSADGRTLYIYRDDQGNGQLYESTNVDETWTTPVLMGSDINSKYFESHLTISADNRLMYFSSDRKGGYGGMDIYRCVRLPNGEWSLAQNVGPEINTKYDENAPYIHPDGKTLYFTSKGHNSMGGYDIFSSQKQDNGVWSIPEHLGYPINSTDDEESYTISPDGKRAYYSTLRSDTYGKGDIYIIGRPGAYEVPLTLVKGNIKIPEGQKFPDGIRIVMTDNESGEFVAEARPIKRNGAFVFIIPPGKNYNITYELDGKEFYNENTYVPRGSEYKEIQKELSIDPLKLKMSGDGDIKVENQNTNNGPKFQLRYAKSKNTLPSDMVMYYIDETSGIIFEEPIDQKGFFKFHEMPKGREYIMKIKNLKDNTLCAEGEIVLLGHQTKQKKLVPNQNCIFVEYIPETALVRFNSPEKDIPAGMTAHYMDKTGNKLHSTAVEVDGKFKYYDMPDFRDYIIQFDGSNPALCQYGEVIVMGKNNNRYKLTPDNNCVYKIVRPPRFKYNKLNQDLPDNVIAYYMSEDGTVLYEENISDMGFSFYNLSNDKNYMIKLVHNDQTLCLDGDIEYERADGSGMKLKAGEDCIYRVYDIVEAKPGVAVTNYAPGAVAYTGGRIMEAQTTDKTEKLDSEDQMNTAYQKAEESVVKSSKGGKKKFETNFGYNQNAIDQNSASFKDLIDFLAAELKAGNTVSVAIESGASRVPTVRYPSNNELAKVRAEKAKQMVIENVNKKGAKGSAIQFIDTTYLVQGPDYHGDPENLKIYEPYQYVKIWGSSK